MSPVRPLVLTPLSPPSSCTKYQVKSPDLQDTPLPAAFQELNDSADLAWVHFSPAVRVTERSQVGEDNFLRVAAISCVTTSDHARHYKGSLTSHLSVSPQKIT